MFRKLFFSIVMLFSVSLPAKSQETLEPLIVMLDASLTCQAAAELTQNYYNIYLGFKQGIEKSDIEALEPPEFISVLSTLFNEYELVVKELKPKIAAHSLDANLVERLRYTEIKNNLIGPIVNNRADPDYIPYFMNINYECWAQLDAIKSDAGL